MAKRTRRQHIVPKFYLKGFSDTSEQIRRVELPGDRSYLLSITNASVIKDFYTIILPDGSESDAFERAFIEIEGAAAEAVRITTSGIWPLPPESRLALANWIALQHLRSEDIRADQSAMTAQMVRLLVGISGKAALRQVIEKAEGRTLTEEELDWEWKDITKPGGPDLTPDVNQHMKLLLSMLDGTTRLIYDCHWTLYKFSRRVLITSDHPVSVVEKPGQPVGLATAEMFFAPLNRKLALTIRPRHRLPLEIRSIPDVVYPGSTLLARTFNKETAARARRYIYHHPDDSPLQELHLPAPETRLGPTASNIDGLIREEGLFHDVNNETLRALSQGARPGDRTDGVSIKDLPWPIPGRRRRNHTSSA